MGFPGGSADKRICLQRGRPGFDPWIEKFPGEGYSTHCSTVAWRIHELYSPWDHKESETTEQLSLKVDTKVNQKGTKVRANVSGKGPNHGVFSYWQEFV